MHPQEVVGAEAEDLRPTRTEIREPGDELLRRQRGVELEFQCCHRRRSLSRERPDNVHASKTTEAAAACHPTGSASTPRSKVADGPGLPPADRSMQPALRRRSDGARPFLAKNGRRVPTSMTMNTSDHLLLVHGDRAQREQLKAYFEQHGMHVTAVATGRHLRAALEQSGPFDLIVLDLELPGDDGLNLCREPARRQAPDDAHPHALRARRRSGPDPRAGDGRRRLPGQAGRATRAAGARPRRPATHPHAAAQHAVDRHGPAPGVRHLEARHRRAPPARRPGVDGGSERRRVPAAARVPRPSTARAQPRPAARPHAGSPDGALRALDRPAGQPPAPAPADDAREPRYIKTVRSAGYVLSMAVAPCA